RIFFFPVPATTEVYTLSLHDALPICRRGLRRARRAAPRATAASRRQRHVPRQAGGPEPLRGRWRALSGAARQLTWEECERIHTGDRKSTRLNSSHVEISYAVFCLKKK